MEFYAFVKYSNLLWSQYESRQGIPHVGSFLAEKKRKILQKWIGKDKFGNGPLAHRIQQPILKCETTNPEFSRISWPIRLYLKKKKKETI